MYLKKFKMRELNVQLLKLLNAKIIYFFEKKRKNKKINSYRHINFIK